MVYGDTQLLREVEAGNMRGVETMLAAGAEPDGRPELNTRPLMVAAGLGKVSLVEVLVARGAGLNSRTCRDVPRPEGGVRLRTGSQAIHAAVHGGSPDVLYVLLQLGADPNAADDDGETPLMIACGDSREDQIGFTMVNILLNGGADPSLPTHFGRTALSYAARSGHTDMIDILLRVAPSRLDQADKYGVTPLCCAVQGGHENSVSRLLSAGATSLRFSMELAVRFDRTRILKMLLTAVHAGESDGPRVAELVNSGPLLRLAALHGHPGVTHVLLAAGADETRETDRGERARDLIGIFVPDCERDPEKEAAIGRMLQRGAAFRSRSLAWPTERAGSTTSAGASIMVPSSSGATHIPLGVRLFQPTTSSHVFVAGFIR